MLAGGAVAVQRGKAIRVDNYECQTSPAATHAIYLDKSPNDPAPPQAKKLRDAVFPLAQISSVRNLNVVSITKLYIVERDCLFGKSVQAGCSSGSHSLPSTENCLHEFVVTDCYTDSDR